MMTGKRAGTAKGSAGKLPWRSWKTEHARVSFPVAMPAKQRRSSHDQTSGDVGEAPDSQTAATVMLGRPVGCRVGCGSEQRR